MFVRIAVILLAAGLLTAPLAACGGGGAKTETTSNIRTTTTGQELMDLKKAYESGAITADEYQEQRKEILERAD